MEPTDTLDTWEDSDLYRRERCLVIRLPDSFPEDAEIDNLDLFADTKNKSLVVIFKSSQFEKREYRQPMPHVKGASIEE